MGIEESCQFVVQHKGIVFFYLEKEITTSTG
jgi:hypothetical protein